MKKKFCIYICLFLFILSGCSSKISSKTSISNTKTTTTKSTSLSSTQNEENFIFDELTYLSGVSKRKKDYEDFVMRKYGTLSKFNMSFSSYGKTKIGFGILAVFFGLYEQTNDPQYLELALQCSESCITAYEYCENNKSTDCFGAYELNAFYGLFKKYLPEDLLSRTEYLVKTTKAYAYPSVTPNHALLTAVGCYLANQYFPNEVETLYSGYVKATETDPTGKIALEKYILDKYPVLGVYEANSNTYFDCHFIPLLVFSYLCEDEVLAKKTSLVIENSIFTLAPIWLSGHMVVGMERTYMPYGSQTYNGQVECLLWYYFGDRESFPYDSELEHNEATSICQALYLDFLPHWISVMMATDRSEVYTHNELHAFMNGSASYFQFMKSYMHQDYGVFSVKYDIRGGDYIKLFGDASDHPNRYGNYRCVMNWGVRWKSEDEHYYSTFSIQHVMQVDNDRSMPFGTSAYEQVYQEDGSVIGIFNVPEGYLFPQLLIYQPDNYKAIIDESAYGRMYIHYGNVIIAYSLSIPFINDIEANCKVRTNPITKAYFVCEVIDPDDLDMEDNTYLEQLEYVQSLCEGNFRKVKYDFTTNKPSVEYTNINNNVMKLVFCGNNTSSAEYLNGVSLINNDYDTWKSQENPWTDTLYGEKNITYKYKNHSITFDFNNLLREED